LLPLVLGLVPLFFVLQGVSGLVSKLAQSILLSGYHDIASNDSYDLIHKVCVQVVLLGIWLVRSLFLFAWKKFFTPIFRALGINYHDVFIPPALNLTSFKLFFLSI
jgi:hypothetical protein